MRKLSHVPFPAAAKIRPTIAAGTVVVRDVPANAVVAGNPAKVVGYTY